MKKEYDSILINTPVSSPLHPQANLPLLKGFLATHGFCAKVIDSNIMFFHYFLGDLVTNEVRLNIEECFENPISILDYYNTIEKRLWEKSRQFDGFDISLRSVSLKYDRTSFEGILSALEDRKSNPFIAFYEWLIAEEISPLKTKIIGIAITFQDQLISAFTLAHLLRRLMPQATIVMGGQMITRCFKTMLGHKKLGSYFDYLVLWDGEIPLLDIHRKVIRHENPDMINVIQSGSTQYIVDRKKGAPGPSGIPSPDFSDIHFDRYLFPEMLVPLQTTRGCYASCEFCAIPFGSNYYRVRKTEDVIRDILTVQEQTLKRCGKKVTYFKFMEDTSSPALLIELSNEIEKRKIDAKWETFARMEKSFAKPGVMQQLFRGGCRKIHWGLESNDPSVIKNMNKKTEVSYSDQVLALAAEAGILNFCFILVGFPGETDESRQNMARYIIENQNIHTITISTFDLTRGSPMEQHFIQDNVYVLQMVSAKDFQVRLPYLVKGENWKSKIIESGHQLMYEVVKNRPDIGFMTLFPDQIRSIYCEKFTNNWAKKFLNRYGEENIKYMLENTSKYIEAYKQKREIDPALLPEPLRREHFRTKEDLETIASALVSRKKYEERRIKQV